MLSVMSSLIDMPFLYNVNIFFKLFSIMFVRILNVELIQMLLWWYLVKKDMLESNLIL